MEITWLVCFGIVIYDRYYAYVCKHSDKIVYKIMFRNKKLIDFRVYSVMMSHAHKFICEKALKSTWPLYTVSVFI